MENSARLLLKDVLEILACMEESVRTSALALIALAQMIIQALVASTNSMLARLDYVRMAQHVSTMVIITPASVPLVSREKIVTKTSLTARKTRAHHQQRVSTSLEDSTANVLSTSLETIAERVISLFHSVAFNLNFPSLFIIILKLNLLFSAINVDFDLYFSDPLRSSAAQVVPFDTGSTDSFTIALWVQYTQQDEGGIFFTAYSVRYTISCSFFYIILISYNINNYCKVYQSLKNIVSFAAIPTLLSIEGPLFKHIPMVSKYLCSLNYKMSI